MANTSIISGLLPVYNGSGTPFTGGGNVYCIPASDSNAYYIGDPVIIAGSADADGVPTATLATAGTSNRITGAIMGFLPNASIVANGYRVASTLAYAIVCDDPNVVYEVQTTTIAATDVGSNVNLASGTGSRLTGSGWYADGSSYATTAGYQLRVLGLAQRANNEIGAYAKILVRINQPTETGAAGSTGV